MLESRSGNEEMSVYDGSTVKYTPFHPGFKLMFCVVHWPNTDSMGKIQIAQNKNNNTTATTTVEAGGNNNNNPTRRDEKYYWLGRTAPKSIDEIPDWFKNHWEYSLIGLSVGFISALLGLGGGIITTTYMSLYTDLTQHEAVATSLIAMVPTGLSATYWHMKAGHVHLRTGGIIGLASALTMYVAASKIAPHCSEKQLRYAFGSLLLFSATRILI